MRILMNISAPALAVGILATCSTVHMTSALDLNSKKATPGKIDLSMPSSNFDAVKEVKAVQRVKKLATPLLLPLVLIMLVNIALELVLTVAGMIWPFKGSPDAKGVEGATPVPRKSAYVGNIIGFGKYLGPSSGSSGTGGGSKKPLMADGPKGDTSSRVWVDNHGKKCVSVMDATSVEPLVVDYDHIKDKRTEYPLKAPIESMKANFYRNGDRSGQFRSLFLDMVPGSENDEQFKVATEAMKTAAKRWIAATDGPGDKDDFLRTCVTAFASTLIIGEEIPLALINYFPPSGATFMVPFYPRFFPYVSFLLPRYWGMLKARQYLHARVKASPRWSKILSKATELGLTPSEACDTLVPMVAFNAQGLRHSFGIGVDFIPGMNFAQELVKDPKALESFALETLRFNGPVAMMPAKHEPTIIRTSKGAKHAVKKGTLLSTLLETAQMDPDVWPEPLSFKGDRYLKSTRTTTKLNPWPTLCHAMPLGTIDDKKNANSHSCVMGRLNYHVVEAFIRIMAELPRYDLLQKNGEQVTFDEASKKDFYARKAAVKIVFHK